MSLNNTGAKLLWIGSQFYLFDFLDLQMVQISLRVLFKPDPANLPKIYRVLGKGEF